MARGASTTEETPEKPTTQERIRAWIREAVFLGVLVFAVLSARSSLADHYYVPSGSMLPTVEIGDHLVVNKLAYGFRVPFTELYIVKFEGPQPGDVVVLESPVDGTVLLKRVVAIPGQRIRVDRGRLVVDGEPLQVRDRDGQLVEVLGEVEHPIRLTGDGGPPLDAVRHGADASGTAQVPEGVYLVMGDNRGESHDGRAFGWVERGSVLGKAVAIYWRSGLTWSDLK